jgi:hypothetical protein
MTTKIELETSATSASDQKNFSAKETEKHKSPLSSPRSHMSEAQPNTSKESASTESDDIASNPDTSTEFSNVGDPTNASGGFFKSAFHWLQQAALNDTLFSVEKKADDSESDVEWELSIPEISEVSDSDEEASTSSHYSDDQTKSSSPTEETSPQTSEQQTAVKTPEQHMPTETSEQHHTSRDANTAETTTAIPQLVIPLPPPPPPIALSETIPPLPLPTSPPPPLPPLTPLPLSSATSSSLSSARSPRDKEQKTNTTNTHKAASVSTSKTKGTSGATLAPPHTRAKPSQSVASHLESKNAGTLSGETFKSPRHESKTPRASTKSFSVSAHEMNATKSQPELSSSQPQNWKPTLCNDTSGSLLYPPSSTSSTPAAVSSSSAIPSKAQRRLSIRLKAPRPEDLFIENISEDDITSVEEDGLKLQIDKNTNKTIIIGGTPEALIRALTSKQRDVKFMQEFLLTLHYFTTPKKVMELLIERFEYKEPENLNQQQKKEFEQQKTTVQLRVIEIIQQWLEINFYDFREGNGEVLRQLLNFCDSGLKNGIHDRRFGVGDSFKRVVRYKTAGVEHETLDEIAYYMKNPKTGVKTGKKGTFLGAEAVKWLKNTLGLEEVDSIETCNHMLKQKLIRLKAEKEAQSPSPFRKHEKYVINLSKEQEQLIVLRQIVPKNSDKPSSKSMKDFNPLHFAKQLTYFEFSLFKKIPFREMNYWILGKKENREQEAPHLFTVVSFVNTVSLWVATEIINCSTLKQRVAVIKRFLLTAQHCLQYKNYNGLLEIILGLKNPSINRLQQTWKAISKKYNELFEKLGIIVSPEHNWKNYRSVIQSETPPFVPYIGLYLSDLTFINDGNPTFLRDGKVNWKKMKKLAAILLQIQTAQKCSYQPSIQPDVEVQNFLCTELYILDGNELYKRSRLLEPPETQGSKK